MDTLSYSINDKICNKFINMIICTNPAKKRNKEITKDNILNIQQLYKLNISICMYKSFHKQLSSAFNNIFQRKTSTVIIRSNSQIIPISCKNTVTKQSIRYIGPKIWNELPEKIKLCKSLSIFVKTGVGNLFNAVCQFLNFVSCPCLTIFDNIVQGSATFSFQCAKL